MTLSQTQRSFYQDNGYLLVNDVFSEVEIQGILREMYAVIKEVCPRQILEKSGVVRSFFSPDSTNDLFRKVTMSKKIVLPAMELIDSSVYIHQTKINSKRAMLGDWWEWHQDYTYWKNEDGMPKCNVLTAMIFLNEINEFNGPMILIPGSHKVGNFDELINQENSLNESDWFKKYQESTDYMSALTSNLKYTLKQKTISEWVMKSGLVSAKGPAGTVLFFHGNIFHASSNNLTPWDRNTFLITYNDINNTLPIVENPRPEFIANRTYTAIIPED